MSELTFFLFFPFFLFIFFPSQDNQSESGDEKNMREFLLKWVGERVAPYDQEVLNFFFNYYYYSYYYCYTIFSSSIFLLIIRIK